MIGDMQSGLLPFLSNDGRQFECLHNAKIDRILKTVREHLGTEIAFVSRYVDGGKRQLTHISSDLELPMGPGHTDAREDSYCWHILEGRLPELILDVADHLFARTLEITDFLPVGCHLNTPLRLSDGSVYGSFCCLSRTPDRSMTERDMGILRAFATLAAEQIEASLESDQRIAGLKTAINGVLTGGAIRILHQPIVELATGRPVGVECLSRFADSEQRSPDKWFGEAAEIGMGVELEMLALRSALATLAHVPPGFYISINVSPETILSGALCDALNGQSPDRLVIEVTEHQQVDDFPRMKQALTALADRARIAIDDIGAGYAGLRHIIDLAPSILKLDMSLTRDIDQDPARRALTSAMVRLAEEIGCKIVAEGIERSGERDTLADLGVEFGQGYLFAVPMPVVAAQQFLLGADRRTERASLLPRARTRRRLSA